MAAALRLKIAGDDAPERPADHRENNAGQHGEQGRQRPVERQDRHCCEEAADHGLPFAADIEQAGLIGERHGKPDEDEARGIEKRAPDAPPLPSAPSMMMPMICAGLSPMARMTTLDAISAATTVMAGTRNASAQRGSSTGAALMRFSRQHDAAMRIEGKERVMGHLPEMAVRIGEISRVAAPEHLFRCLDGKRPGCKGAGESGIDSSFVIAVPGERQRGKTGRCIGKRCILR